MLNHPIFRRAQAEKPIGDGVFDVVNGLTVDLCRCHDQIEAKFGMGHRQNLDRDAYCRKVQKPAEDAGIQRL